MSSNQWLNKGTVAGVATIVAGILSVFTATGHTPPDLLISIFALLGGFITTKDSIDIRK